jgi:hypothetical protein
MGTHRYDTAGATGAGTTTDNMKSRVKAYLTFNGTGTPAILESFNTSSLTDSATGVWGHNLTNVMNSANYPHPVNAIYMTVAYDNGRTAGSASCAVTNSSFALFDPFYVCSQTLGILA